MLEPISAINLAKNISDLTKTLFAVAKEQQKQETKEKLNEVIDALMDLKQRAVELEDENRELKEQLRFKSDDFEYRQPFFYDKSKPNVPLCPKCFVEHKRAAPMSQQVHEDGGVIFRKCNVCDKLTYENVRQDRPSSPGSYFPGGGGPNSWMGD